MKNIPDDPARTCRIEITNRLRENQTLRIVAGKRLHAPPDVNLVPGEKVSVIIKTSPEDVDAIDDTIQFGLPGFIMTRPVHGGRAIVWNRRSQTNQSPLRPN